MYCSLVQILHRPFELDTYPSTCQLDPSSNALGDSLKDETLQPDQHATIILIEQPIVAPTAR